MNKISFTIKLNKEKLQCGDVVFLKQPDNVNRVYDSYLAELVKKQHRFVLLHAVGRKPQCVAVGLLSTNEFLNQEKCLGIKLEGSYGDYGNGKTVYMDANNIWLIKVGCIESKTYSLTEIDRARCAVNSFIKEENVELKIGLPESGIVKNEYNIYRGIFSLKVSNEQKSNLITTTLFLQIENCTEDYAKNALKDIFKEANKNGANFPKNIMKKLETARATFPDEMKEHFYRSVCQLLVLQKTDREKLNFVEDLQKGYNTDESNKHFYNNFIKYVEN